MRAAKPALVAVLATIAAGCGDGVSGPDIPPALDVVVVDGVRFQASTRFSEEKPDHVLVVTMTATNEGADFVDVRFEDVRFGGACAADMGLLVHDNPNREGDAIWDNIAPTPPTGVCQTQPRLDFALPPGASQEIQRGVLIDEVLSGRRPSGRYYFTAVLPLASGTVAVKAGALELTR